MSPRTQAIDAEAAELFGSPQPVMFRPRFSVRGNPRYAEVRIDKISAFFRLSALLELVAEARAHAVEIAFLCMGRRDADPEGAYTIVEELPLVGTGTRAHVEMPPEAKLEAQRRHAALDVVGWAHTHPNHGVFFSATDIANCRQYGQHAINLVYDPVRDELGIALGPAMRVHVRPAELFAAPPRRTSVLVAEVPRAVITRSKRPKETAATPKARSKRARGAFFLCVVAGLLVALSADHDRPAFASARQAFLAGESSCQANEEIACGLISCTRGR